MRKLLAAAFELKDERNGDSVAFCVLEDLRPAAENQHSAISAQQSARS